ncbi:DNA-3-methyladenine glycosylase [Sinosporangium siamense]|uniref:Putative 3-methyladenine DNA glycosylase n=1 Tax=Sinosporangium siamense TaxID=1367973 RepID=A0A919VEM9_9ACTN|nr:DNA-3-methyladenine glycosylase [Sinosporangium siamense]GII95284.1 putative 3-methyladenine DNA glycosylase [Sinosporangium siamense]
MGERLLEREFFDRPAEQVAPGLLGHVLVHVTPAGRVAARLTEVEAYGLPGEDPASHTYRGQTPRNSVMFGEPGHMYVYFTYGMHFCANLVCLPKGMGSAVLLRAGEIVEGAPLARAARERSRAASAAVPERDLGRGPARLAVALGLGRDQNGLDCCLPGGPIRLLEGTPPPPGTVKAGPRTGIANGKETLWRFWIEGDPTVSPHRQHVPRRRA